MTCPLIVISTLVIANGAPGEKQFIQQCARLSEMQSACWSGSNLFPKIVRQYRKLPGNPLLKADDSESSVQQKMSDT